MAHGDPALRLRVRHRRDGRVQLGRPGERGLLGGVLLLIGRMQRGEPPHVSNFSVMAFNLFIAPYYPTCPDGIQGGGTMSGLS